MNHRSNMDYILVSFLVAERTALSYAVGEWARIWPIEQLIRAARGAHLYLPRGDQDYAIEVGLRMLTLRRIVRPEGGLYRAAPEELALLRYYAGSLGPGGPPSAPA